jgi:hypothetical protein
MASGAAMRTPEAAVVTVADGSIASVDAHGVVTAKATGTTTLSFASGAAKASIRLDVVAGSVGKPSVGAHPILGVRASVSSKIDHLLVVDDQEWPTYVTSPWILSELLLSPAIVARWTGSGFGAELVGEPLDAVSSPSIARDARGRTYVSFKSVSPTPMQAPTRIAVAERAADGGPGDWTYRELPRRPSLSAGAEIEPWFDVAGDRSSIDGNFSLFPRDGGGVWVGYRVWGTNPNGTSDLDACLWNLRLAQVADAAVTAEDVEGIVAGREACLGHGQAPSIDDLFLVPPKAAGGAPGLAVQRPPAIGEHYDHVVQFTREAAGWSAPTRILPPADPQFDNLSIHGVSSVALVQPLPAFGDAEWVKIGIYQGERTDMLGLRGFGSKWTVRSNVRPLDHEGPYGIIGPDDPQPFLAPSEVATQDTWLSHWPVRGAAVSSQHLDFVVETAQGTLAYATVAPARLALHTDTEADGVRLTTEAVTPVAVAPVAVVAGGSRMVTLQRLDHPSWGGWAPPAEPLLSTVVLRSAQPGKPYVVVPPPAAGTIVSGDWLEIGGSVVGLAREPLGALQVLKLTPAGDAFDVVASMPSQGNPVAAQALGRALFVVVPPASGNVWLLASPDPLAGKPFTNVLASVPGASLIDVDPANLALLAHPSTNELFLLSRQSFTAGHLRLDVFGADGALHETHDSMVPLVAGVRPYERIRTAAIDADGTIYLFATVSHGVKLLRSRDRLKTVEVAAEWAEQWYPPTAIVQLGDGRLAFAASRREGADVWKVGVWTSLDGTKWTGPTLARPDGGNGQRPAAITADPAGGALVLLHDNESMRAWGLQCGLNASEGNLPGNGPDAVVVHVAP